MSLFFQLNEQDEILDVKVNFDITNNNMKQLTELFDQIESNDSQNIIFNFQNVNVIDSLGLGKLLKFYQKLRAEEKILVFCELNNQIKYLFHITQLESIFTLAETDEEAIDYIKSKLNG